MFDTITRCFFACLKGAAGAALKRWLQLSEKNRLRSRAARKVAAPCGSTLSATLNSSNNKNSWLWKNANAWWCPRWPGSARWRVTCCWLTWGREFHSGPEPLTGPSALGKQQCSLSLYVFWPPVFVFNYPLSYLTFFSWRTVRKPKFSVADPDPSGSELVCRIQINHIFTWIRILRSRQDPDASLQNLGASFGFELFGSANIAVNCLFSLLFDGCKWVPSFSWGIDGAKPCHLLRNHQGSVSFRSRDFFIILSSTSSFCEPHLVLAFFTYELCWSAKPARPAQYNYLLRPMFYWSTAVISALQWLCNADKSYHKPGMERTISFNKCRIRED